MGRDPYRYFRIEAQELLGGLGQGLLALEKGSDTELVRRLLRQAHTLKGASRVVKRSDIGDLAHAMEDLLEPHRETGGPVARGTIDHALELLDRMRDLVVSLGEPPQAPGTAASDASAKERSAEAAPDDPAIRVRVSSLDALLESAEEASIRLSSLRRQLDRLDRAHDTALDIAAAAERREKLAGCGALGAHEADALAAALHAARRAIGACVEEVRAELDGLRSGLADARLVPLSTVIGDLERVARDAARMLEKDVELRPIGVETHVDAHVLHGLRGALVHLVRNAVAHGIEDRATRSRTAKPPVGRIDVTVERRGHRAFVSCRDDGQGLALEAVRAGAVARGHASVDAAAAMDAAELGRLLLRGGVSTSKTVTDVSGRGVGLDAVQRAVDELKGEIAIESVPGQGTVVSIAVPVSLSAMPALAVEVDGASALFPLDAVRRTVRVKEGDVVRDGDGERLLVDGRALPFLRLGHAIGRSPRAAAHARCAVVVEAGGEVAAMGVDRLEGARSVIVRSIPAHAAPAASVAGAALDDEGRPQLVLFVPALIRAAATARTATLEAGPPPAPPLLVVDDSLTTRMLEQSIFESAGYEVDLAVSAEDALEKVRARTYGALIVDVEMPGMDGFELLETLKRDPRLCETPAILVTSRADPADKRRGKEVGARAYIVKSEFDQGELLEAIRRLVG